MRTSLLRALILGLVWLLTPGLTEATENLWHLLWNGHGAHSLEAGVGHAPAGDEHGCTGTYHFCSCHPTPASALASLPATSQSLELLGRAQSRLTASPLEPRLSILYRPPRSTAAL